MLNFTGSNFVGGSHENGFGIHFELQPDKTLSAAYTFDILKQGPPGVVHGGAIAAVLDEAMTAAVFAAGKPALTVNLMVDYRAVVRINTEVQIIGRIDLIERRKLFTVAKIILADGTIAAEAKALFITTPHAVEGSE
jgi:acyl-coenzyme A thioesterase PaaI-like protein